MPPGKDETQAQLSCKGQSSTHLVETAVEMPSDSMKHMALVVW
jgi:hypothetical protein